MKKSFILLSTILFALVSCGEGSSTTSESNTNGSTDSIVNSGESSSSNLPINPSVATPKSITELYDFLNNTAKPKENSYGSEAKRAISEGERSLYNDIYTTINSDIYSYSDNVYYESAKIKKEEINIEDPSKIKEESDTYKSVKKVIDSFFYEVTDYTDNSFKEDSASKKMVDLEISESKVSEATNLGLVSSIRSLFSEYILPEIIIGADGIDPIVDLNNGSFSYNEQLGYKKKYDAYSINTVVNYQIRFDKDGMLTYYLFSIDQDTTYDDFDDVDFYYSLVDEFSITNTSEKEVSTTLDIDPLDYYLVSYDIQLFSDDGYGQSNSLVHQDPLSFPIGFDVKAEVINQLPEKALDTKLTIVDSSNQSVIKVTKYAGHEPTVKSIGIGSTTLTIQSESGITKTIDVNVVNTPLESINLWFINSLDFPRPFYVGEKVACNYTITPENNIDELEFSLNVGEDVAKIVKEVRNEGESDEETYYYLETYKAANDVKLKLSSVENPNIFDKETFDIKEKFSIEEINNQLINSTWYCDYEWKDVNNEVHIDEKATMLYFGTDNKGYFKVLNNSNQGLIFEEGTEYEFTWQPAKMLDDPLRDKPAIEITPIELTSSYGTKLKYSDNRLDVFWRCEYMEVTLALDDPEMWYYTFSGDFYKDIAL